MTNSNAPITFHPDWNNQEEPLTKREYFAAIAMQGILANHTATVWAAAFSDKNILTKIAVSHADELIKALNVNKG